MNNHKRIKKQKFHINKIKKRMRYLKRKNKRYHHVGGFKNKNYLSLEVYDFLKTVNFDNISITDRLPVRISNGVLLISIPEVFSITNNPEDTINILKKVFYYGCNENVKKLVFSHMNCKELEIAASTIMDSIVMACKSYRKSMGDELFISGDLPKDAKARKILIASGLPAHLNLQDKLLTRQDNMRLFSLVAGKSGTGRSGEVSTQLTDYINRCLITQEYKLTDTGLNMISRMFSEVIDNCELHGGDNSTWYALGHFNMIEKGFGEENLVIFNYGNSIYQQLISNETTIETREKIEYMKKCHQNQYDMNWNEETMLTVFSLQQGVSRLRDQNIEGNRKRGTGTAIMLDTFYTLGGSIRNMSPEFSITSGHAHILFDQKYKIKDEILNAPIFGSGKRKVIAFNTDNDLFQKADNKNVTLMKQNFPGTIISMKFYIDHEYLQSLTEGK